MKTVKKRSQKQEKSVAQKFGGRVTAASGALWGMKGDVRTDKFLIECKTTEKIFYRLTAKVWEKIEEEAVKDHMRTPLMMIDLEDSERYVVFNPKYFNHQVFTSSLEGVFTVKNSLLIEKGMVGYGAFDDYTSAVFRIIEGKKSNVLCVMLLKDFEEEFKEEL